MYEERIMFGTLLIGKTSTKNHHVDITIASENFRIGGFGTKDRARHAYHVLQSVLGSSNLRISSDVDGETENWSFRFGSMLIDGLRSKTKANTARTELNEAVSAYQLAQSG